jgi:hypothetical protein
MKTLLSIALAFACLALGYSLGKRHQLETNRAEIQLIARDYAKCLDQIDTVTNGYWLRLRLDGPGYNGRGER